MARAETVDQGASIPAQEGPALSPPVSDPSEMRAEYRRRRDPFDYLKVHPADVESKGQEGWQLDRTLTTSTWLKKKKLSIDGLRTAPGVSSTVWDIRS